MQQKAVIITGAKGSGKSTLIKTLFPHLDVDFSEVAPYKAYDLSEELVVAEVCCTPETLNKLLFKRFPWKLHAGLILVDGSRDLRVDGRSAALISDAPLRALVLTKAEDAVSSRVEAAKALATRLKFEYFSVSSFQNTGIDELREWVLTGRRPPPKPKIFESIQLVLAIDLVPVLAAGQLDKEVLSEHERNVLKLCDGKRGILDIAKELGLHPGRVRSVVDGFLVKGYLKDLRPKVIP